MKIRLSARARADLADIYEFIARDSPFYARRTIGDLLDAAMELKKFPQSGRIIPKYGDQNLREKFHSNYRIAYSTSE
jgi:toxin ParE1/3/4